ncbi:hypothetical protein ACFXO9_24920 [Nocardia tengchongensis]|uniref:hypothetical protein n=1 Tax=Nocardia tengchongensis TaxID=2055889 RepID=UPI0036A9CEC1
MPSKERLKRGLPHDPHKRSATIEAIDPTGKVLAAGRYSTDTNGYTEMLTAGR